MYSENLPSNPHHEKVELSDYDLEMRGKRVFEREEGKLEKIRLSQEATAKRNQELQQQRSSSGFWLLSLVILGVTIFLGVKKRGPILRYLKRLFA